MKLTQSQLTALVDGFSHQLSKATHADVVLVLGVGIKDKEHDHRLGQPVNIAASVDGCLGCLIAALSSIIVNGLPPEMRDKIIQNVTTDRALFVNPSRAGMVN